MIYNLSNRTFGNYESAFFDFDGTVAESGEGIIKAVRYMFSRMEVEIPSEEQMFKFIGPPVKYLLSNVYGMDTQQIDEAYAYFREYYQSRGVHESRLYRGIIDALKAVRQTGTKLYVATCKGESMARKMLEDFEIIDLFDGVFGAWHDKGVYDKTHVLQYAVERLEGQMGHAVMIGDRAHDVDGGKAVGMDTAAVLYGYGCYDELAGSGCDFLLDSVADLITLLGGEK